MDNPLRIGRLAAAVRVSAATVRFYESIGLVPPPRRTASGNRIYPPSEVQRLRLIGRAKLLGLSLAEIKELVTHTFGGSCSGFQQELLRRIPARLAEIDRRIDELEALRQDLAALHDHLAHLPAEEGDQPVAGCVDCPCVGHAKGGE